VYKFTGLQVQSFTSSRIRNSKWCFK